MRLYLEGHNKSKGQAISRTWSAAECSRLDPDEEHETEPVRYVSDLAYARKLVDRWNRRHATH